MPNSDGRMDADKDATHTHSGRVKDGVSGNTNETLEYQENKTKDSPHGAAPDVPARSDATEATQKR